MKKVTLALDYKLPEEEVKRGLTPERASVVLLVKLHDLKFAGGQTLSDARKWSRLMDNLHDDKDNPVKETEIDDEKFEMVKELVRDGKIPVGYEEVATKFWDMIESAESHSHETKTGDDNSKAASAA